MELCDAASLGKVTAPAGVFAVGTIQCPCVFSDRTAVVEDIAGTSNLHEGFVVFHT
jgi:hypothetical protein